MSLRKKVREFFGIGVKRNLVYPMLTTCLPELAQAASEFGSSHLSRPAHEAITIMDEFIRDSSRERSDLGVQHFAWQFLRRTLTHGSRTPDGRQILPPGWHLGVSEPAPGEVPHIRLYGPECFFAKPMDGEAAREIAAKFKAACKMQP